jgi:Ca-activated chloride channel family protein
MMARTVALLFLHLLLCSGHQAHAAGPRVQVLLIFDASRSMSNAYGRDTRMATGKSLFTRLVDSLAVQEDVELALRIYGGSVAYPPGDCRDSRLVVPFGPGNTSALKDTVLALRPTGITPIAHSLEQAPRDFGTSADERIVILITDGIEECDGDPCAVALRLRQYGIALRPFIIGVGIDRAQAKAFDCVGPYYDVADFADLGTLVAQVTAQALHPTTAQVDLLGSTGMPTTTDVPMVFQDRDRSDICQTSLHTFNEQGLPDTLEMDPFADHRITVYTLPPVQLDHARHVLGTHNTFTVNAPVGTLIVEQANTGLAAEVMCVVRQQGQGNTLVALPLNSRQRLLAGHYDLEFLTLPRLLVKDVTVRDRMEERVVIAPSGRVHVTLPTPGVATILLEDGSELVHVIDLPPDLTDHQVRLQPGAYRLTYRPAERTSTAYTIDQRFSVESNKHVHLDLTNP